MKSKQMFALSVLTLSVMQAVYAEEVLTPALAVKSDTQLLGDVVVSASKIAQSSIDAPANVAVITASKIEKTQSQRIGDVLTAKVPGLYLRGGAAGNGRPGVSSSSTMRGQGGFLNKIAVLVDGQNMVDAYSGNVNWAMVDMDAVERIEVVPGVGSALYGGNAMAGVIAITTKAPTKQEIMAKAGFGFGDAAGKYASTLYRDKFSNGMGLVIGAGQRDRDGYISEYVSKAPAGAPLPGAIPVVGAMPTTTAVGAPSYIVGDKGRNASTERGVHAKLYYDLTPAAKIHAGFAYNEGKSLDAPYSNYLRNARTGAAIPVNTAPTNIAINGKGAKLQASDFFGSVPMGNTTLRYFAGYESEVLGDAKLSINAGVIQRDNWNAAGGAAATFTSGAGTMSASPNSTSNVTAQLTLPASDSQVLIVGVANEIGTLHQKKYALSNWKNVNSKTAELDRIDARSSTNSIFLQDQIAVAEKLTIYAGGRYDAWKAGGKGVVTTGTYPGTFSYADRQDAAFSPKVSGVYAVTERFSLKSSVGTGFRPATNYYLFANPTFSGGAPGTGKMIYSNPNLKPEKNRSFDLSTEYDFVEGGNFKAAYFITKTTDMIYSVVTAVPAYIDPVINKQINFKSQQQNTGGALARGIELSGEYPVLSWLTIGASYAYTDAKITSVTNPVNAALVGKRPVVVPKDTASLALEVHQGDWAGVLSARHVGQQFNTNDNTDSASVFTGYSVQNIFDLKAGYQISHDFKANLMVDNLFNKTYYEYYRMPGRGVTAELSAKF
ncbi:MAG: TonB-dependent receptor [Sideroxydans sp.]|nr:TonB-dependent receptor [Sideroxydans sp.]